MDGARPQRSRSELASEDGAVKGRDTDTPTSTADRMTALLAGRCAAGDWMRGIADSMLFSKTRPFHDLERPFFSHDSLFASFDNASPLDQETAHHLYPRRGRLNQQFRS